MHDETLCAVSRVWTPLLRCLAGSGHGINQEITGYQNNIDGLAESPRIGHRDSASIRTLQGYQLSLRSTYVSSERPPWPKKPEHFLWKF